MARTGRPRIEIDEKQFEKLCSIQCTLSEIANINGCSEDTIERWCKRTYKMGFADAFKRFSATGKMSLRRIQFKMAEHNVSMAIWLGKQYLGQREQQAVVLANEDDSLRAIDEYLRARHDTGTRTDSGPSI